MEVIGNGPLAGDGRVMTGWRLFSMLAVSINFQFDFFLRTRHKHWVWRKRAQTTGLR